ncbi:hypothetical protein CAOG_07168 [Capsaspora owczarzaki ATCC 30864]|uniref:Uncharacterized protein n=1 Tax=Capsaspora owczarzaki (strain ATCC 30864) TaxID=595528 RepID=A0A0D2UPH8_CAPO3|nr:hypothetical protein CAOG_07168 [Capsaspora owczarzaki ATCC 30864]KJE96921.1 hypothetical protein CAOG_007168 [Capsaspora owczarzaki ATCC 30864]|eukprot:XP_004343892.2 hypothetical protein CAOG_07168 [Capsaspora owczarzaki ATCC 30864]
MAYGAAFNIEESLREAACKGDELGVRSLVSGGANVNSQHLMNKWTALHWAVHRNHVTIAAFLVSRGAQTTIQNASGKTPGDMATSDELRTALGLPLLPASAGAAPGTPSSSSSLSHHGGLSLSGTAADAAGRERTGSTASTSSTGSHHEFVPNYLRHPEFPYTTPVPSSAQHLQAMSSTVSSSSSSYQNPSSTALQQSLAPPSPSRTTTGSGYFAQSSYNSGNSSSSHAGIATRGEDEAPRSPNAFPHPSTTAPGGFTPSQYQTLRSLQSQLDNLQQSVRRASSSSFADRDPPLSPNMAALSQLPHGVASTAVAEAISALVLRDQHNRLVVKTRVAGDFHFVELELPTDHLTYASLLEACSHELGIQPDHVAAIHKLPNTLIRKDSDVARLAPLQEIELVLARPGRMQE